MLIWVQHQKSSITSGPNRSVQIDSLKWRTWSNSSSHTMLNAVFSRICLLIFFLLRTFHVNKRFLPFSYFSLFFLFLQGLFGARVHAYSQEVLFPPYSLSFGRTVLHTYVRKKVGLEALTWPRTLGLRRWGACSNSVLSDSSSLLIHTMLSVWLSLT